MFLLERIPPWHSNRLSRLIKTPKLHLGDTGVACALLGMDTHALARDRPTLGQLIETFVLQELRRLCHNRYCLIYVDADKNEVAAFVRRLSPHPACDTQAKRAGSVIRVSSAGLWMWRLRATKESMLQWPQHR